MIGVKTPFRISFSGGSTDIDYYYKKFGGKVISTTISKYMFHFINHYKNENESLIKYSKTELIKNNKPIQHPIVNEISKIYDLKGLDIHSIADIPKGSGLASSSAYTIGLIKGLSHLNNKKLSSNEIAEIACKIEISKLKGPIGKQDQYAIAFGGLNLIEFHKDETVTVKKINIGKEQYNFLNSSFLLVKAGNQRSASAVLKSQKDQKNDKNFLNKIHQIKELVQPMHKALIENNLKDVGELLTYNWKIKSSLTNKTSNKKIDEIFDSILKVKGIYGGKLLGAGAGGYLLVVGNKKSLNELSTKFNTVKFNFEPDGTQVIFNT